MCMQTTYEGYICAIRGHCTVVYAERLGRTDRRGLYQGQALVLPGVSWHTGKLWWRWGTSAWHLCSQARSHISYSQHHHPSRLEGTDNFCMLDDLRKYLVKAVLGMAALQYVCWTELCAGVLGRTSSIGGALGKALRECCKVDGQDGKAGAENSGATVPINIPA